VTSISHEIKQPVGAITLNAEVARALLQSESPDLKEAVIVLKDVIDDTQRIGQILANIHHIVWQGPGSEGAVDINELIAETLRLLRGELTDHGIATSAELTPGLPPVLGRRVQLQEVILNLMRNAIEAMTAVGADHRSLIVRTFRRLPSTRVAARLLLKLRTPDRVSIQIS
jgi:C4-dicarboxylate-specific signal transduction histidine kinase